MSQRKPPVPPVPTEGASQRPAPVPHPAPPEDESADPVGDGHSDAQWAKDHPAPTPMPRERAKD